MKKKFFGIAVATAIASAAVLPAPAFAAEDCTASCQVAAPYATSKNGAVGSVDNEIILAVIGQGGGFAREALWAFRPALNTAVFMTMAHDFGWVPNLNASMYTIMH